MAILCGWPGPRGVEGERLRDLDRGRHWRDGVCSRDERETAGSWAVGLFPFHPRARGQSLDTEDER